MNLRPWILSALTCGALSGGCNLLLGLEEAQVRDGGDAGASSGGGSSGGSSGSGGSSPGEGVARYVDGTCGSDVALDEETITSCVYRVSCDPLYPVFSISECIAYDEQGRTPFERCAVNATSCEEVANCLGRVEIQRTACLNESWNCIDGEIAVNCQAGGTPYAMDCSFYGGTCLAPTSDTGAFAFASCAPLDSPTCLGDPTDGARYCSGDVLYTCVDGVARGVDCTTVGSSCFDDGNGQATCTNITTACDAPGTATCTDEGVDFCFANAYGDDYSCQPGTGCQASGSGFAACVSEGCAIDTACSEGCEGSNLRVCRGGSAILVDCVRLGFNGCSTAADNAYSFCSGYQYSVE